MNIRTITIFMNSVKNQASDVHRLKLNLERVA